MKETTSKKLIEIGDRMRVAREKLGFSQVKIAELFGCSVRTYQKNETGLNEAGVFIADDFIRLGINANWLLTGEGEMLLADMPHKKIIDWGIKPVDHAVREPAQPPSGFVFVPRYDVAASMGNGSVIHNEQIVDHLAFREEWVRTELSANPKNLVLISAIGDSMEPTLRAGDLLLIDRSSAGVKHDAIYAFATNGELRVKRMQLKIDGSLVVKSDNHQYESEILSLDEAAALQIVGRVVWSGRRM